MIPISDHVRATRRIPHMEQALLTLPQDLNSPPDLVRFALPDH